MMESVSSFARSGNREERCDDLASGEMHPPKHRVNITFCLFSYDFGLMLPILVLNLIAISFLLATSRVEGVFRIWACGAILRRPP